MKPSTLCSTTWECCLLNLGDKPQVKVGTFSKIKFKLNVFCPSWNRTPSLTQVNPCLAKGTLLYEFAALVHSQDTEIDMWAHVWHWNIPRVYVERSSRASSDTVVSLQRSQMLTLCVQKCMVEQRHFFLYDFSRSWYLPCLHWECYVSLMPWPEACICYSYASPVSPAVRKKWVLGEFLSNVFQKKLLHIYYLNEV